MSGRSLLSLGRKGRIGGGSVPLCPSEPALGLHILGRNTPYHSISLLHIQKQLQPTGDLSPLLLTEILLLSLGLSLKHAFSSQPAPGRLAGAGCTDHGWVLKVPTRRQEGHQGIFAHLRGPELLSLSRGIWRFN